MSQVTIVGAGAFGTALAGVARSAGHDVLIWAREPEVVASITQRHANEDFLPGVVLDPGIAATSDLPHALATADAVLLAVPAQHVRAVSTAMQPHLPPGVPVVICAKGIESTTGALLTDVLAATLPDTPVAILSGPMFAGEVGRGLPAAATIASTDAALAERLVHLLGTPRFRPYHAPDVVGVQVGGSVKNVIAIAAGVIVGREMGESARAALVTRGLAEMVRLGVAMGASPATLMGLSGLGDLVLTCGSPQSRNMSFGIALGQGESAASILAGRRAVTEGVPTAGIVVELAERLGIDVPICRAVHDALYAGVSVDEAIGGLLARELKAETPRP